MKKSNSKKSLISKEMEKSAAKNLKKVLGGSITVSSMNDQHLVGGGPVVPNSVVGG
jgi:translation initiation factor 6 (eIF-6)